MRRMAMRLRTVRGSVLFLPWTLMSYASSMRILCPAKAQRHRDAGTMDAQKALRKGAHATALR